MSARLRAIAARLLLQASGLAGAAGPRLAALCARAAEVASDAAHLVSPVAECPGCGAATPALALVGVEVCLSCQHAEEVALWDHGIDRTIEAVKASDAARRAVNVTPYTTRRADADRSKLN